MASYRFCRSDDVPLVVQAYETCVRPHFPGAPQATTESLKRAVREIDLWTSGCMVAVEGDEPVALLVAGKRETEAAILALGVRPDRLRSGHGRHLVTSISAKLAILGPSRIVTEVPADRVAARALFEGCGFRQETEYTDWVCASPTPGEPEGAALVVPVSVDDLDASGALAGAAGPWEGSPRALGARKERLRGLAVAGSDRIEAWLLHHERTVVALDGPRGPRRDVWLGLLLHCFVGRAPGAARIAKLDSRAIAAEIPRSCDFEPAGTTLGYAADPARR